MKKDIHDKEIIQKYELASFWVPVFYLDTSLKYAHYFIGKINLRYL
jgi:hypothetical protein